MICFARRTIVVVSLLALSLSQAARAQDDSAPPAPPPQAGAGFGIPDPKSLFGNQPGAYAGVGFGQLGSGDWWAQMTVNTDFSLGPVVLGLALPVDILIWNDDSSGCSTAPNPACTRDDKAYWSFLRKRDWDQFGDYARFIRYVQYGHKRDPGLYALFGQEWDSSIGHGTIVSHYNNSLLLDHPKAGIAVDYNGKWAGGETLTDELVNPTLIAGRAFVRPFGGTAFLRAWAIGASYAADVSAPRMLKTQPDGSLASNEHGEPVIASSATQSVFGFDTEYELLANSIIHLVPYLDLNRIVGGGNGAHLGVMTQILLPIPILDVRLDAKLEYRVMQAGYIPEYFDQEYDLSRVQYARLGPNNAVFYTPKAQAVRDLKNDPTTGNQGYYGELGFNFAGFILIGGSLQNYQTDSGASLGLYLTVPKLKFIKVQGYYLRKNFGPLSDAFTLDDRSLLGGSAAYNLYGPFYLRFDYQRTWVLNPESSKIEAASTFNIGIASSFSF